MHALKNTMRALLFSINFPNFAIRNFGSLTTFAKKPLPSSNVVLTHCRSAIYCNGLKPHWRKIQKLSKNPNSLTFLLKNKKSNARIEKYNACIAFLNKLS